jgi:hypothetical protein
VRWCATGQGSFNLADVILIRRALLEIVQFGCSGCLAQGVEAPARPTMPGDLAPRGVPDGRIDVADVVVGLRLAVGLDAASALERLVADVAPARLERPSGVGTGDGALDVADVVRLLRGAVGLEDLAWPEHRLAVHAGDAAGAVAFLVLTTGWPAEAEPLGVETETPCGEPGGLDVAGDRWGVACASDPEDVRLPGDLLVFRYRAKDPVDPASLRLRAELVGASLEPIAAAPELVRR